MNEDQFIQEIFQIAFGFDAHYSTTSDPEFRSFTYEEVVKKISEYSNNAYKYDQLTNILDGKTLDIILEHYK